MTDFTHIISIVEANKLSMYDINCANVNLLIKYYIVFRRMFSSNMLLQHEKDDDKCVHMNNNVDKLCEIATYYTTHLQKIIDSIKLLPISDTEYNELFNKYSDEYDATLQFV